MSSGPAAFRCRKATSSSSRISPRRLRLIAARGPDVFYRGEIAQAIVAAQLGTPAGGKPGPHDATGSRGLQRRDPRADRGRIPRLSHRRRCRPLIRWADHDPGAQDGRAFSAGRRAAGFGFGKATTLHVMAEAMRLAFADRACGWATKTSCRCPSAGCCTPTTSRRAAMISVTTASRVPAFRRSAGLSRMARQPGRRRRPPPNR